MPKTALAKKEGLSFVLPIAKRKGRDGRDLDRLRILLSSFLSFFDLRDLTTFWLLAPPSDIAPVKSLLREMTSDSRFEVVSETDICPELKKTPKNKLQATGWFRQQLVKLAAHELVRSNFYMTLDADVICVRPFSCSDVIKKGKALCNTEYLKDYRALYKSQFALREMKVKQRRISWAEKVLGISRSPQYRKRIYGETPVLLNTRQVGNLTRYLEEKHELPWRSALLQALPWTEYPLYFQFLESTGKLDSVHLPTHRNAILSLDHSFWHSPNIYRSAMAEWDPEDAFNPKGAGYLVVVQSFLGIDPKRVWEVVESYIH
jgi:hypothetical protein